MFYLFEILDIFELHHLQIVFIFNAFVIYTIMIVLIILNILGILRALITSIKTTFRAPIKASPVRNLITWAAKYDINIWSYLCLSFYMKCLQLKKLNIKHTLCSVASSIQKLRQYKVRANGWKMLSVGVSMGRVSYQLAYVIHFFLFAQGVIDKSLTNCRLCKLLCFMFHKWSVKYFQELRNIARHPFSKIRSNCQRGRIVLCLHDIVCRDYWVIYSHGIPPHITCLWYAAGMIQSWLDLPTFDLLRYFRICLSFVTSEHI